MNVILFGPPGVGKGTQAKLLCDRIGFTHLSTGDALRNAAAQGTAAGMQAKVLMERGELVPDGLVTEILHDLVGLYRNETESFLFDGYPRTLPQVFALDGIFEDFHLAQPTVISLEVDATRVVSRLAGRRLCGTCKETYNLNFNPPQKPDRCDKCGGELIQRADDRPETIRERLRVYAELSHPVFDEYSRRGWLSRIDGVGRVEAIHERILMLLGIVPTASPKMG